MTSNPGEAAALALTPWQRHILNAILTSDGGTPRLTHPSSRRNGKAAADRAITELGATLGLHLHRAAPDGLWCVTAHPIGYLYTRLPPPQPTYPMQVIYDERQQA